MELVYVNNHNKKAFIRFYEKQYLNNFLKRNSLSGLLKGLLNGTSEMCKAVDLEPLMIVDKNEILMICVLAYAYRMPSFLQISFFEATSFNAQAFQMILDRANIVAKEKGAMKISASLNVHVNYGLGFLASDYDKNQTFGMAHNPEFYHEFFENNGFETIDMVSYRKDMSSMEYLLNQKLQERLNKRYKVRPVNFKDLKTEARVYTQINNDAFSKHLFYYTRKAEEDLELFKDFKFLLKPENLLFVEKEGKPVGFMLWYPDFHELMSKSETLGLSTVIKNKFLNKKIKTFKIVEIGVIPSEVGRGASLALFQYCFQCTKGRFDNLETGWILKTNERSKGFGVKWADCEYKKYKAYMKDVE